MVLISFLLLIPLVSAVEIDPEITQELSRQESVSVIVFFNDENSISLKNIEHEYASLNAVSANVSAQELQTLLESPEVDHIDVSHMYSLDLAEVRSLVNVSHSLQVSGMNMTGQKTICIIDSGINYTHESLGSCSRTSFLAGTCAKVLNGTDFVNDDGDPYDDHGHGTHVAGIAAGNGSVNGIAPNARLVIIKACSAAGLCSESNVLAGIEWCTQNAEVYNISVISMSLGDNTPYTDASCPTSWNTALAFASAKNMTIVASSGNEDFISGISHPACALNVISVGATYDANLGSKNWGSCSDSTTAADKMVCFSNRFSNLDLVAPGSVITSASMSGTVSLSGTSMSAPVIAGMVVVLEQYALQENNQLLTPSELQSTLNASGVAVPDPSTGLTFRRPDLSRALILLDRRAPSISNASRYGVNVTNATDVIFSVNVSDTHLSSVLFESDVSGVMQNYSVTNFSITVLSQNFTNHALVRYRFLALDANGNMNSTIQENFTVLPDTSADSDASPSLALLVPLNDSFSNASSTVFSFTLENLEQSSCSLFINHVLNQSNVLNVSVILSEDEHLWSVFCSNSTTNVSSEVRTVTIDRTLPLVDLVSPLDGLVSDTSLVSFSANVSDAYLANCSFLVDNSMIATTTNSGSIAASSSFSDGLYTWSVECVDRANNHAIASRSFSVSIPSPPAGASSGSGGGGGGGSSSQAVIPEVVPSVEIPASPVFTLDAVPEIVETVEEESEEAFIPQEITGSAIQVPSQRSYQTFGVVGVIVLVLIGGSAAMILRTSRKPNKDNVKKEKDV